MKKITAVLAALLCLAMIFPISVCSFALFAAEQFDESFLGELPVKIKRLDSIEKPKAVIIGGSSVAFGLRSDILSEQIGMEVVNFGLYASLGTKIMLDLSKKSINKGDVIVIAPEQDSQTLSNYFSAGSTLKAFDGSFKYLARLDSDDIPTVAGTFLSFAAEKYKFYSSGKKPVISEVYTRDAFNEFCDISYKREYNEMIDGHDPNTLISFDTEIISNEFIDYLNEYAEYAHSKGASVYFSFSPMNRAALEKDTTPEIIREYFSYLQEKLNFPVISSPEKYLMDSEWFYDSNFHMNDSGAILHTKHLAEDIILALGQNRDCTVEEPSKPEKPKEDTVKPSEADPYFTFREIEGGLEIIGLTEKGAAQKELTVPQKIGEAKVISIEGGAFAESSVLEKLIINDGIRRIGNGAFRDCQTLTAVYVNIPLPKSCVVSDKLMDGASEDCMIYVSDELFGAYITDYNWSEIYGMDRLDTVN